MRQISLLQEPSLEQGLAALQVLLMRLAGCECLHDLGAGARTRTQASLEGVLCRKGGFPSPPGCHALRTPHWGEWHMDAQDQYAGARAQMIRGHGIQLVSSLKCS